MIVLLFVSIATVALFVLLLVELAVLLLGGGRPPVAVDRIVHGILGGRPRPPEQALAAAPPVSEEHGTLAPRPPADDSRPPAGDSWVRHDAVVEEMVRERLYGRPDGGQA